MANVSAGEVSAGEVSTGEVNAGVDNDDAGTARISRLARLIVDDRLILPLRLNTPFGK